MPRYKNGITSYTAATLPASLPAGQSVVVDGWEFYAVPGGYSSECYSGSGVPFVLPSSGNITSTSGDVTVTTAFYAAIGPSYTWFQQGSLYTNSPAGWYFTNWTSTTTGKVYSDVYLSGEPSIPDVPTPITTVVAAYTQVINQYINGPTFLIPGSVMGKNGILEWHRHVSGFSSANQKTTALFLGLEVAHSGNFTNNSYVALSGSVENRGTPYRQVCCNSAYGDSGLAGSLSRLVTDTSDTQFVTTAVKLAAATDYVIIEAATSLVKRGV